MAITAPNDPPRADASQSVASGIRRAPLPAIHLSNPNKIKVITLMAAKYQVKKFMIDMTAIIPDCG